MNFQVFGFPNQQSAEPDPTIHGGKGAGLIWMSQHGMPVPPGFIIPTSVWTEYTKKPKGTMKAISKALPSYLDALKQHFGYMPLVSVRSGARVSCPGMMDTILNVGIDQTTSPAWQKRLGQECFASSLHRLVTMYGSVVAGIKREKLEKNLAEALKVYEQEALGPFPDAKAQLLGAIEAVFKSWDNERAKVYRKMNGIPREWGTAVTVQAMVFGNLNDQSCTGVLFTRNPDTGAPQVTGEFLPNAQGEDIVAGIKTPMPILKMVDWNGPLAAELHKTVLKLETLKADVQDVEFTVQDGKLYLLQTRNAKRSAVAAIRIALDMRKEGLIDTATALSRVTPQQFDLAQLDQIDPAFKGPHTFTGLPACSGVVKGRPVFSVDDAVKATDPVILISYETTPDDIAGMKVAQGVITMVGGYTSHAAVVSRGMNRACITGVGESVDAFKQASIVTMDGLTGRIWLEDVPINKGSNGASVTVDEFSRLLYEVHGAIPVFYDVPSNFHKKAMLYVGNRLLDPTGVVQLIAATKAKVETLYVDFTLDPGDAGFFALMDHTVLQEAMLHILSTEHSDMDIIVVTDVETCPFPRLPVGTDLRTLVLAEQELAADMTTFDMNDPAIAKVLQWKQSQGLQFISLGKLVKGTPSVCSIQTLLTSAS